MFVSSTFYVRQIGLVDFNNLSVPCKDYILVGLIERDTLNNDNTQVRISCTKEGQNL